METECHFGKDPVEVNKIYHGFKKLTSSRFEKIITSKKDPLDKKEQILTL